MQYQKDTKNFCTRFVMDSNSFWKFYLIYCRDANSGLRSVWTPWDSDSGSPIGSLLHHTPKLGILVESVQFLMKFLLQQIILAVYYDFHWVLVATKLLKAKLHSLYVKELESEILERSELESDILPPTPQPWMPFLNDGLC